MSILWIVKELLTAVKMNNFGIQRLTFTEQQAIIDSSRLNGDHSYNTDRKTVEVYQRGTGSTYEITEQSNFLFRSQIKIGIGATKKTVHDEAIVNYRGISNTRIFVYVEYQAEVSLAGEIDVIVTDGITPVNSNVVLSSNPTPSIVYKIFELDTSAFAIDKVLNVKIDLQNCKVQYVEITAV